MASKAKISLTIDRNVVEALDMEASTRGQTNRSELVQSILRSWLRARRRLQQNEAIAAYYRDLSPDEAEEDARWSELSTRSVSEIWDEA